jgi:cysteine sulfinate desulfinase/cysteine desulfurase-like protein
VIEMARPAVDLDQNATTPLDPRVREAMLPYLHEHYGNPSSATGEEAPSHVLLAMGVDPVLAKGTIRFSLGKGTSEADIELATGRAVATVRRLRELSSLR